MSDWQVGDLAVCVDAGPCRNIVHSHARLRAGKIYLITSAWKNSRGLHVLVDHEPPHIVVSTGKPCGWHPDRFRKIDKHEDCEPEFAQLLQNIKLPEKVE